MVIGDMVIGHMIIGVDKDRLTRLLGSNMIAKKYINEYNPFALLFPSRKIPNCVRYQEITCV